MLTCLCAFSNIVASASADCNWTACPRAWTCRVIFPCMLLFSFQSSCPRCCAGAGGAYSPAAAHCRPAPAAGTYMPHPCHHTHPIQTAVNEAIVAVQQYTFNTRVDAKLGEVGM